MPKSGERLLNTLLFADVGKHVFKYGYTAVFVCRYKRPHSAIRVKRPIVFIETVLPPVLGPVMTRESYLSPSDTSMGTAFSGQVTDGELFKLDNAARIYNRHCSLHLIGKLSL